MRCARSQPVHPDAAESRISGSTLPGRGFWSYREPVSSPDPEASDPPRGSGSEPIAAYIVLSHREPEQVERLVAAVRRASPGSYVFVSHDRRHSGAPRALDDQVHVREHGLRTDWGSWELVQSTLEAFRWARAVSNPDVVALISGADYPVRDLAEWERAFVSTGGGWVGTAAVLRYRSFWGPRHGEGSDELTRYTYRWFRLPRTGLARVLPERLEALRRKARDAVLLRTEPAVSFRVVSRGRGSHVGLRRLRTPFSDDTPCVKGSQWVAMDRRLLDLLLQRVDHRSALVRLYRRSIIPDESLIPSVLSWVQPPRQGPPVSYVEWLAEQDSPRTMDLSHLDVILASGAPFVRKVGTAASASLMDALDLLISPPSQDGQTS